MYGASKGWGAKVLCGDVTWGRAPFPALGTGTSTFVGRELYCIPVEGNCGVDVALVVRAVPTP